MKGYQGVPDERPIRVTAIVSIDILVDRGVFRTLIEPRGQLGLAEWLAIRLEARESNIRVQAMVTGPHPPTPEDA
jgi:hypothetical protein